MTDHAVRARIPVRTIADEDPAAPPNAGAGLCLSGGGYRAMLFHLGTTWRLYEIGMLQSLDRVSSVSGGSITAAVVGMRWEEIAGSIDVPGKWRPAVVEPIRALAGTTIDRGSVIGGVLWFGSVSEWVEARYREALFRDATLQDLPDDEQDGNPRFVINATNVQSGALWRFSRPYMRDWKVGEVKQPDVALAKAVAASSAFPPVLSPCTLALDPTAFTPRSGATLQFEPYTREAVLSDGGVYDNLGLETVWKRLSTVLVSDAGGQMAPQEEPAENWAGHSLRVLSIIDNQVRALRKRQLIASYLASEQESHHRGGAYWGIRSDMRRYPVQFPLPCPHERTMELADVPTRLKALSEELQCRLINWGYAACDAAVRSHMTPNLPAPPGFPYPQYGV